MSEVKAYPVPEEWRKTAHIDNEKYLAMYRESVENPDAFWGREGKRIDWIKPYTQSEAYVVRPAQRLD